jgi:type IV pilus assembly protein PilM
MIIDIFIPEKIGSYFVRSKRIIGFDISKSHVNAAVIYASGSTVVIEKFLQEGIDTDTTRPYPDRVSAAIQKIITQIPSYNEIHSSLSSSIIVFKELRLPFIDREKINMVLNYEIEPYLPFLVDTAIIDFIITKTTPAENSSEVMIAAVQKQHIVEHRSYFEQIGLQLTKVSVDLFDLYGLYREIPAYGSKKEIVTLIDLEFNVTRIACIVHGQLRFIRTIPKGIAHLAKSIANSRTNSNGQSLEDLIRFGIEKNSDQAYTQIAQKVFMQFLQEVNFTLQSFIEQLQTTSENPLEVDKIILLGRGSEINGIDQIVQKVFQIPCTFFDGNELLKIPSIRTHQGLRIPRSHIISLAAALPNAITEYFNILRSEFLESKKHTLFIKQFFTAIGLILCAVGILIVNNYIEKRKLVAITRSMERSVVTSLKDRNLTDTGEFIKAIDQAAEKISREEELWFAFSRQQRFSFLKALQDLSIAIDRQSLGLKVKKLIMSTNDITLEGEVQGFEELKILERQLKESNLFTFVPTLQELKFNEKLPLKKNGEIE